MNFRSPAVMFAALVAAALAGVCLVLLAALIFKLGVLTLGIVPVLITIAGVVSCLTSGKPSNTILLWIVIIILAPLLGPLLWFVWGKKNT